MSDGPETGVQSEDAPALNKALESFGSLQPNEKERVRLGLQFWSLLLAIGVSAGVTGGLLMRLLRTIEHLTYHYGSGELVAGAGNTTTTRRIVVLLVAGVLASGAGLLLHRMRGETELCGAIWLRSGRLPVLKASLRALYSIVVVGMGAAVGRENALKQMGAVVANLAANWRDLPDEQRRLLVACGGGAGMAAAYNVPLGGALFTLEILLGSFSIQAALPVFAATMLATASSWLFLPNQPTYTISGSSREAPLLAWAIVCGPLCGLMSVAFVRLIAWAKTGKLSRWQLAVLPLMSLAALGVAAVWFPEMLGNGKDVVQMTFFNSPGNLLLLVLLLLRPLATATILRGGVPGGVFTPCIAFGAVLGLMLGRGWVALPGLATLTNWTHLADASQLSLFAFLGAGAVLAAATQGPVSAVAFMMELAHADHVLLAPLLLAVVSASLTARRFEVGSIYSVEAS